MNSYANINLLQQAAKPLKYLGKELNLGRKSAARIDRYFKILLVFPGGYELMLNHPWFEAVYHSLCNLKDVLVDFVCMPEDEILEFMEKHSHPLYSFIYHLPLNNFDLYYLHADHEGHLPAAIKVMISGGLLPADIIQLPLLSPRVSLLPVLSDLKIRISDGRDAENIKHDVVCLRELFEKNRDRYGSFRDFWKENRNISAGGEYNDHHTAVQQTMRPIISWVDTMGPVQRIQPEQIDLPVSYSRSDFPFHINLKECYKEFDWNIFSRYVPFWSWIKDKNWFEPVPGAKIQYNPVMVQLTDTARADFLAFIKKYPYPVVLSAKDLSRFAEDPIHFFNFLEAVYADDWKRIYLFVLMNTDESFIADFEHLHEQLRTRFGQLDITFFIQPDIKHLLGNEKKISAIQTQWKDYSAKMVHTLGQESIVFPSSDVITDYLYFHQKNLSLLENRKDRPEEVTHHPSAENNYTTTFLRSNESMKANGVKAVTGTEKNKQSRFGFNGKPIQFGRTTKRVQVVKPLMKKQIRIHYVREAGSEFFTHQDVIRVFIQCCRKAGIQIIYKGGKNPRPRLSYAPPLNTGFLSRAEYIDFHLEISENESLKFKLNSLLPKGIKVVDEKRIMDKAPALAAAIELNEYAISGFDFFDPRWIDDFIKQSSVIICRIKGDEESNFDIRPFVEQMDWENNTLTVTLRTIDNKMARVTEILDTLLPQDSFEPHQLTCIRTGQFALENGGRIHPMEMSG